MKRIQILKLLFILNFSKQELFKLDDVEKGLSENELNGLSSFNLQNSSNNDKTCSVCQMEFQINQRVTVIACIHKFHTECITQWLHV